MGRGVCGHVRVGGRFVCVCVKNVRGGEGRGEE